MVDVKQVNVDSYGFEWPKNYDYAVYQTFMSKYISILSRRTSRWDALMKSKDGFRRSNKVKRYIRKGVPTSMRSTIWMKASEAEQLREERPDLYQTVLKGPFKADVVETITLDIPRTFPDNIYFKDSSQTSKKHSLYNVLLAFAHQNPQIGYCQGLNFIAGIMLLVTNSEDTTFWLLQSLVEKILPDYYTKQMTGLLTDIGVLEELVRSKIPEVHEHMVQTGVSWSMYVSKWFICLFAEVLPVETVLRIWDSLFYEGSKILLRVAVTLVVQNKEKILAANNFVEITEVFKSLPFGYNVTDCHSFMQAIFRAPGSFPRAHILKLREYCREKVEKEQQATQVLQEQQRQRQAQEKQAREEALEKQLQAEFEAKQQLLKEAVNGIEVNSETESGCGVDNSNVRKSTEGFEADASKNEALNVIRINDNDENFSTTAESYIQKDDGDDVKRYGETTEPVQTTGQVSDKVAIEVNILGKQEPLVNGEPLQSNGKISPSPKDSEGNGLHV